MNKIKIYNRFLSKIYDIVGEEYTLITPLDDFINTNNKVEFRHNICGNTFTILQGKRFIAGGRCPICANKERSHKNSLDESLIVERLKTTHPDLEYLGGFINTNSKIRVKCKICSFEFEPRPVNLFRKNKPTGCPKCSKNPRKDSNYFRNEIKELTGNEYELLSEYINNSTYVSMKHTACNRIYQVKPATFLNGRRCPFCNGGIKLTQKEISEKIYNISDNEYKLISEYKNNRSLVTLKHLICGYEYKTTTRNFINGFGRCPFCNETKGEMEIRKYLTSHNYQFIYQYKLKDFSTKMSFDFFDVDNNVLIEYDGDFHYIPFSEISLSNFIAQKNRDYKKNEYCSKNNIKLLRIPFWLFDNIEDILDDFYREKNLDTLKNKYEFDFNNLELSYLKKHFRNKKVFNLYKEKLFDLNDYRKNSSEESE